MKLRWKPAAIVLCVSVALIFPAIPAGANRPGSLLYAPQDSGVVAELVTLEEALARARARLAQVQAEIASQKSELASLEARLSGLQDRAGQLRHTIEARMISLYKHNNPSLAEIIVATGDLGQVLELQEYSTRLASDDIRQIQAAIAEMGQLSSSLNQLEAGRDQLAELERQAAAEVDRINRQVAQRKQ